jgi:hypothetical protein
MSGAGTLELVAREVGQALAILGQRVASESPTELIASLGLELPPALASDATLVSAIGAVASAGDALATPLTNLISAIETGDDATIVSAAGQVISAIGQIVSALSKLGSALDGLSASAAGLTAAERAQLSALAQQLARRLFDYTFIDYLSSKSRTAVSILALTGLIDNDLTSADPSVPGSAPYIQRTIHFERLGDMLSSPGNLFKDAFDWGAPTFDGSLIFPRIAALVDALRLPVEIITQSGSPSVLDAYILRFAVDPTTSPPSLTARLRLPATEDYQQSFPLNDLWTLTIDTTSRFAAGMEAAIKPPLSAALTPPTGTVSLSLTPGLAAANADNSPIVLFGETSGSVLQVSSVSFGSGVTAAWDSGSGTATGDVSIQFAVTGGKLVVDMSEADGFLSDVTSGTPIEASFAFAATWSPETGLHVTGGAQLEIDLPLHIDLGPVTIETVYIVGGAGSSGLTLELSVALGVVLGPIQASVDRVGVTGDLSFPSSGGNLGPVNLAIAFKPPDGLGLEIDVGPASGGGYISFDPAQGQYAGVLQVSILDVVQVEVIGVIDTIMPDGSSGFSFVLIITFNLPPIPLGFGFTLNGVGGLGGINRTINTNALQAGFVAHSLNSILFPPDPIANAPEIISNIRNFFPVAQNSYVFGPMMEVGWGTPTLITLEIGVILELPNPVVIVLLGLVDVALPDADAPLIQIHIDILGELDFGTKTLELEGDMYDSSVLIYSMAGSLYFSVCWGNDPNFVYSVGGFNPDFNVAGLNIPPMQRCSVSIGVGDNPRISANNYFAVTSNSLQFGANVQAYASAAGFSIQGYLGFDVLIIFSPFSFEFDFTVSFSVSFEGVNLLGLSVSGSFSGPRPWNFNGSASISILFWTVSASVNLTWGDSTPVTIPQKPVLPDLANALQTPGNWSAALPAGMTPAVSLTTPTGGSAQILIYPMGTLSVRENVTPLDVPITRYGNATPSDGNEFAISDVQINNQEAQRQTLQEYFAPGQFNALSDADKLSAPSFELYDAGVTIGSSAIDAGEDSARTVVYEEFYIDSPMSYSRSTGPYLMDAAISAALGRQGAGFLSPVTHTGMSKYSAGSALGAIATADAGFVIANTNDLSVRSDLSPAAGMTYFQARSALATHLASTPADSGNLQIMSLYEVAA